MASVDIESSGETCCQGGREEHPGAQIITAPMRILRVNQGRPPEIEAKSRLIIPGHRDPQLGLFRTDSPTTSPLVVLVCATIAMAQDWSFEVFDVTTAFLSGMDMSRELYVEAPREGLPAVPDLSWPKIAPYALFKGIQGGRTG